MDTEFYVHYVSKEALACSVTYKENPRAPFEDSFLCLQLSIGTVNCKTTGQVLISVGSLHTLVQSSSLVQHTLHSRNNDPESK
jgi:hypothetical protein